MGGNSVYQPLSPDPHQRLISKRLNLALERWHGVYEGVTTTWLRWSHLNGELLPTPPEARDSERQRANAEAQRAEVESQRANAETQARQLAEVEIARLQALLTEQSNR